MNERKENMNEWLLSEELLRTIADRKDMTDRPLTGMWGVLVPPLGTEIPRIPEEKDL